MRTVHFAPYAPSGCGMYEAARDMVVADVRSGHETFLVDTGSVGADGIKSEPKVGEKDSRGGVDIVTSPPSVVAHADVIVMHTGIPDSWIVKCQAPIVVVMHGRPAACFATEVNGSKVSYSLMAELATWPRIKAMVTFWKHHVPFWHQIVPPAKLKYFPAPPIDGARFCKEGESYDFAGKKGKWNLLMADAWREDIGTYEVVSGALEATKRIRGLKVHLFSMPSPTPNCWEHLFQGFRRCDGLGAVWGRRTNMEEVYRGVDLALTPQRIVTRSVGEPICCGVPVIADEGCEQATYQTRIWNPKAVADSVEQAITDINYGKDDVDAKVSKAAEAFSLEAYSKRMNEVYEEVTACG